MDDFARNLVTICMVLFLGVVSKNGNVKRRLVDWIERNVFRSKQTPSLPKCLATDAQKLDFSALCKLHKYTEKALQVNHVFRRRILGELSKHHQQQLFAIKQLEKFNQIDSTITANNGAALTALIESYIAENSSAFTMNDISRNSDCIASLSNLTETVSHMVRDYNSLYYNSETLPLVDYILQSVSKNIQNITLQGDKTDILVPGSGLGRVAYEVAKNLPDVHVTSVEFNDLMYITNRLIYSCRESIKISPWAIDYSNHQSLNKQLKSFTINCSDFSKPANLDIRFGDFRKCSLNSGNLKKKQLIVVTVFFMDTAENILEYLEKIESFKRHYETVHWINIGPLKYGSRPKVVLTAEEFTELRASRGWKDVQYTCSANETIGYITNSDGLYKGSYSVVKFHSVL